MKDLLLMLAHLLATLARLLGPGGAKASEDGMNGCGRKPEILRPRTTHHADACHVTLRYGFGAVSGCSRRAEVAEAAAKA